VEWREWPGRRFRTRQSVGPIGTMITLMLTLTLKPDPTLTLTLTITLLSLLTALNPTKPY